MECVIHYVTQNYHFHFIKFATETSSAVNLYWSKASM